MIPSDAEHAILAPSDADTWVVCAAKPLMVRNLLVKLPENPDHVLAAKDGTASHWAMAEIAAGRMVAEGQITDDGHILTQEMIDGAQLLVDDVLTLLPHIPRPEWHVEQRVNMARRIHAANWGTPDLWVYDPTTRTIYLWDYKFGYGIVEVFENWQLVDYLAGILEELERLYGQHLDDRQIKVVFTIVQPRAFHPAGPVRRWHVSSAANLRGMHNRLEMAADDAMSGFAKATPNPNCMHCEARHVCQALQQDAYRSAQISLQGVPLLLSPEATGLELTVLTEAAKRLEARINGLMVQGEAMAREGKTVPGWRLDKKPSREQWTDQKLAAGLARTLGIDIHKPDSLVTPNQARKAGLPDEIVAAVSERAPAKAKFEPVPEWDGRRMFGKY
jgi:hypothetical protein